MPKIYNAGNLEFHEKKASLSQYCWHASENLSEQAGAERLNFNIKSLDPGKFSYPYHFHHNCEEVFVILSGGAMLRSPDGFRELRESNIVFLESGPSGAHQLYNHTDKPCVYLDLGSADKLDVCEYPDTGKVNILPEQKIFATNGAAGYFDGEQDVESHWPENIINPKPKAGL